ncbi:SDR family NAD(P)-dependent oxidoreductase [Rothia sp. AR01]|uniref:SDR family NAD(P)-dependent oxidoreductase n=1 Tax=Rothia santali TaxID=2949643 RepID=A0A9X2HFE4_9MICC|nr:SDR family NAD(P)-dependent oxidoreductase [Rothia santali]MCP3426702.1 SDR family NAD(P)-dependent oxidoreductase [Rothia santali]
MEIRGTTAIVTGGASGLGAATARALAARGADVFAFDLAPAIEKARAEAEPAPDAAAAPAAGPATHEGAASTTKPAPDAATVPDAATAPDAAAAPPAAPGRIAYAEVDVTDPASVRAGVERAVREGAGPLRVAVNCAGIGPSARILGRSGVHDFELYAQVVQVNLVGTFHVLALAAEAMAGQESADGEGQRGVVVNTASVAAYEGQVGQAAYASSKGGVVGLTLAAARDLAGRGIRVNTVAPGIVDTPMMATIGEEYREGLAASVPFPHRLARPEEYARLVLMLVEHDYLNGETIRMDGALRMPPR